jgi:hypothetical protein
MVYLLFLCILNSLLLNINFIFINKLECKKCKKKPAINIHEIENETSTKINQELAKHGHKLSRKINNKFRVKAQAIEELKQHYIKFHNLN